MEDGDAHRASETVINNPDCGDVHLCTTTLINGERFSERKRRLQESKPFNASVWVDNDGTRIRKTKHRMCMIGSIDGVTHEQHFGRTSLHFIRRGEEGGCIRRPTETVEHRTVGMFRSTIQVKSKNRNSDRRYTTSEDVRYSEDDVDYVDIPAEAKERVLRANRKRRMRYVAKTGKRRRVRKMVSLEQFRLFDNNGLDPRQGSSSGAGRRSSNGGDTGDDSSRDHEERKFMTSVEECMFCTNYLFSGWADVPYLRCFGGRRRSQKYVCVATVRMKVEAQNGDVVTSVMVSFIIEEESRRVRNICARRERRYNSNGCELCDRTILSCSCDANWNNDGMMQSKCWHVDCVHRNTSCMERINAMLECGILDEHRNYFGDFLNLREKVTEGRTVFERDVTVDGQSDTAEFGEDGLVAVQLDDVGKEELLRRGDVVAKRWSAWLVIDIMDRVLVTVTWKRVNRGVEATRMTCMMCRGETSRRCRHEVACQHESLLDCGTAEAEDNIESEEGEEGQQESNGNLGIDNKDMMNEAPPPPPGTDAAQNVSEPNVASKAINKDDEKSYYVKNVKRSFMFCRKEKELAEKLTDLIETESAGTGALVFGDPDGTRCEGKVLWGDGSQRQCSARRKQCKTDAPRRVTLFTLNHGDVSIMVLDWVCRRCSFVNGYRGNEHGIFPAKFGTAYTVELMYWWLHEMCSNTNSFRSVYETTRKLQFSPTYNRKFNTGRLNNLDGVHLANRRHGNEAIRVFISSIDIDSCEISRQLFSCSICEIDLEESDRKQLGWTEEECRGRKRLTGVVIDAKVVALLKESKTSCDPNDVVHAVTGLRTRIVTKRDCQNAIKCFLKLVRSSIESRRSTSVRASAAITRATDSYVLRHDKLSVRLGAMMKYGTTKGQRSTSKVVQYINMVAWYIDPSVCMCTGHNRTTESNHDGCAAIRRKMASIGGQDICREILGTLFTINHRGNNDLVAVRLSTGTDDGGSDDSDDDEESASDMIGANEIWVEVNCQQYLSVEEQLDTTVELMLFCLLEPISLGFFPYHTAMGNGAEVAVRRTNRRRPEASDGASTSEGNSSLRDRNTGSGDIVEAITEGSTGATARVNTVHENSPVQTPAMDGTTEGNTVQLNRGDAVQHPEGHTASNRDAIAAMAGGNLDSYSDDEIRGMLPKLASEAISLHRAAAVAMEKMGTCRHDGRDDNDWICPQCISVGTTDSDQVMLQNAIVGRYIRDVVRCGRRNSAFTRNCLRLMSKLVKRRVDTFEKYIGEMGEKMEPSCINYWKRYGTAHPEAMAEQDGEDSLYIFPGRKRFRPAIKFEKIDKQECTKVYVKGDSTVPSFLTVQCSCAHPKLLGFVLLRECESISAAISSVITHFQVPPRRVWYDNACNMYDSAVLRVPWMLRWTMLVVDRFHYSGHVCSNIFNGNVHRILDKDRSVSAEVINSIIDKGTSHIAYLKGSNVIPFMKLLFGQINGFARLRDTVRKKDLEDEDILHHFRTQFTCYCDLCSRPEGQGPAFNDGISAFTRANTSVQLVQRDNANVVEHSNDGQLEGTQTAGSEDPSSSALNA